nr:UvrD-like helicase, ATP-binding domain, P-loop containing nucleoside triphosphate hydrolase [Tanacetum cinerariifolium]
MSKEDLVNRISKSVFVTNFLDSFGSRDFWKLCEAYGKVVDVFVPNLVLDDSCIIDRDLSCHAMRKVKDVNPIPNLLSILAKEGFLDVKLSYLGGLWVLFELYYVATKDKFLSHNGVNSWFSVLQAGTNDFICDERVVWVDIEGIPVHLWSRNTFLKLGSKWGEALDIEERYDASFARKCLWILTKLSYNILESFKAFKHEEVESEDESPIGDNNSHVDHQVSEDGSAGDSDGEGVSETVFGDKPLSPVNSVHNGSSK